MKKSIALFLTSLITISAASCGGKSDSSSSQSSSSSESSSSVAEESKSSESESEPTTEAATKHVSPTETVSTQLGIQKNIDTTIEKTEGKNTVKIPLADLMREGDKVTSFTFVIYSADGTDIGEFKGGCGISVDSECTSATDEGWYQADDFTAPTEGTYGEITWNVPADAADHISPSGDVLFGYWWGNSSKIRVESVCCNLTRTSEIPCDGTVSHDVGESVGYDDTDNTIHVPTADFLPQGAIPQAVTYNISSSGGFRKFVGAFGYGADSDYYQSADVVAMTDSSQISLTWIVDAEAKSYASDNGELVLGYWWSEQTTARLDSVTVKYSLGDTSAPAPTEKNDTEKKPSKETSTGFRSSSDIVKDIKVGWNLGNSLDSYDTAKSGVATETGWGNPKTTEEMIISVKNAGFNAVRVPVTWGEHMDGDVIQAEWLDRVQEVVDYAYDNDMYVIVNLHHDDAIWFNPTDAEYPQDSAKLKKIWEQLSERFKDYGDRLIFEGINEERTIGSANEWMGGTADERAVVNKYIQDFVDTVRASGGNNAERSLIVTSYGACAEEIAMNDLIVPNDDHIIVSLHYYAPWKFSAGESTTFGDSEKAELDAKFASMKSKFIDKGHPLIIDEFGCVGVADDSVRSEYYSYYISAAKSQGIKCFVWDNGVAKGKDGYGLLNRHALTWNDTILSGIMGGAK